jgi:putative PIG3 family NAD(P)H quinone oxidoreductase
MANARAVRIRGSGGPDVLSIADLEVREPGPGEVRVKVAACGLNRADILQRRGLYPAPPGAIADVPGLEYAGTVDTVGPGVTAAEPGTQVMGIVAGGAMATAVVVHEREVIAVPAGLDLVRAAAIPEVFLTAYDALMGQAEVGPGSRVLIHSVAGGVGTAAVQLAAAAGARALGTSRTREKLESCAALGLEYGIHVQDGVFAQAVHEATGGAGVDVILDTVGAAYLEENLRALAVRGRLMIIGLLGGIAAAAPLALLLSKRCTVTGTVLRSRPLEEKAALAQRFATHIAPLFATDKLVPVIDEVMAMSRIKEAHERMEQNRTTGKLVLTW